MKSIQQKLKEADQMVLEMEAFFRIQQAYFYDRTDDNLNKLQAQTNKMKQMIKDYKGNGLKGKNW